MGHFYLFQEIIRFLFHAWAKMDNEIYKQHGFFLICTCVLILLGIL
jgi:hypothetical protein